MRVAMVPREVEERGPIAKRLRAARERLELTLENAAADAGVPLRYARLLEGEKPSDVGVSDDLYLIPFFRRYAAALGLPAEELLPDFLGQVQELPPPSPMHLATRRRRARGSFLRPVAVIVAIAAAVVVIVRQAPERASLEDERWGAPESERADGGDDTLVTTATEPTPNPAAPEHDGAAAPDHDVAAAVAAEPAGVGSPASRFAAEQAPAAAGGTTSGLPAVAPSNGPLLVAAAPSPPAALQTASAAAATRRTAVEQAAATRDAALEHDAATSAPAPDSPPADASAPLDVASAPAGGARELRIVAAEQTWLSLAVDDEPRHSILLQPGEARSWTAARAFTLTVGNAGGITVSLDGRELPPLGRSGQVVRNLRLPQGETTPG